MKKLKTTSFANNLHFLVIPIILIALALRYPYLWCLFIIYLIYIIKNRIFIKNIIFISLISTVVFMVALNHKSNKDEGFTGVIVDVSDTKYKIRSGFEYIYVYSKEEFRVGDRVEVKGSASEIKEESYKNGFSYKLYLKYNKIYNVYYNPKITYLKHYHTISGLKHNLINYYNQKLGSDISNYLNTLVFGYNTLDEETSNGIKTLGISHLFAISGFHIMLIFKALYFILNKIFKNDFIITPIISIFFIFYIFFTSFNISILRSSIMLILMLYNKLYNKLYTTLDNLSFSIIIALIINPLYIYQTSFILTYLITFVLIIASYLCKSKHKIISSIKITFLAFMASLPIVCNINGSINLISILLVPIFTFIVGYILLPYMFSLLILPTLKNIGIIKLFNYILNFTSNYNIKIRVGYINIYFILIYYLLFILILIMIESKKKNKMLIFISFFYLLLITNLSITCRYYKITMIDVGQGDSILLTLPFNKGSMLIDSYGYNLNYLKHEGIRNLDYLILTHTDSDHIEGYKDIIDEYNVKNVYTNIYDDIEGVTKYLKSDDSFYFGDILVSVLSPISNLDSKNNNSLVLQMNICGLTFLFTGDIEESAEEALIKKYGSKLRSDVLKVAHHGSSTSSTSNFIKYVNPRYSLISLGKDNKYKFPHESTILNLSKSYIYRTDLYGNINIKLNSSKFYISGYKKV